MSVEKKWSETSSPPPTASPKGAQNNAPEQEDNELKTDVEDFQECFLQEKFPKAEKQVKESAPEKKASVETVEGNYGEVYQLEEMAPGKKELHQHAFTESLRDEEPLRKGASLEKGKDVQGKKYLEEEVYPGNEFKVTPTLKTLDLNKRPLARNHHEDFTSQIPLSQFSSLNVTVPTFYLSNDGNLLTMIDQTTQTEWFYESTSTLSKEKAKDQERYETMMPYDTDLEVALAEEDSEDKNEKQSMESASETDIFKLMEEASEAMSVEDLDEKFLDDATYQTVFRKILREMALRNEMEEDIDISMIDHLECETRRKLGILLKKNFEKYKETILWLLKKRKKLNTFTFRLLNQKYPEIKKSEVIELSEFHHLKIHRKKKLELDIEWMTNKTKEHEGDGSINFYPTGTVFQVLFPDGTGQIHYPSGNLAMLFLRTSEKFTYIILEDCKGGSIRALINNSGHATFYDENNDIRLNLSFNLGYYFIPGKGQKAWNWWNLKLHTHAPPVQPISLKINRHIKVQIKSQDKVLFSFITEKKQIHLNLGTKYKYISPEVLTEMKNKRIPEVEFKGMAQKTQLLLAKMSKILSLLSIADLENFVASNMTSLVTPFPKTSSRFSTPPGSFSSLY